MKHKIKKSFFDYSLKEKEEIVRGAAKEANKLQLKMIEKEKEHE